MMHPALRVSIVIRAFNEGAHIGRLLTGIEQQTIGDVEVIVVDSGSTDQTVEIATRHGARIVHIQPGEFTFGRSLNRGVAAASGEIIVIISAHCYPVYPDWLEKLIRPFDDPQVAVSYGKQRGGATNWYSEHRFFRKYFPDVSQPRQGNPYAHNANAAIRRSLWVQQPYDEALTGLEDLAWSSWAFARGYGIAYVAEAEVIHLHDETPRQVHNRYRREAVALRQILPASRFTLWNFLRLWLGSTAGDLLQARREGVLGQVWRSVLWFRWMQYWGTFLGYHFSGAVDAALHQAFYYPPGSLDGKPPAPRGVQPIDYGEAPTDGIIESEQRAGVEMSRICKKAIDQFLGRIVEQFHPEKVILFGSYARGNPTPDSDVDVLVVLPFEGKPVHKATEIMLTVKHPGYPVDLLVRTPDQVSGRIEKGDFFMRDILENGEVYYESDYK